MENRSSRVSETQWNIILEFLEQNPSLARGYNNSSQGRRESSRLWHEVAELLNSQESGTTKSPKEWSTYVSNYKSKIKKTVTANNADASGTGGGTPRGSLSELESRFLAVLGPGAPLVVDPLGAPLVVDPLSPTLGRITRHKIIGTHRGTRKSKSNGGAITTPPQSPHIDTAPPMRRRQSQRKSRLRGPLAPIDEARRILSQVEMQRAAADAANARALELIGLNLGRLADAAERVLELMTS